MNVKIFNTKPYLNFLYFVENNDYQKEIPPRLVDYNNGIKMIYMKNNPCIKNER